MQIYRLQKRLEVQYLQLLSITVPVQQKYYLNMNANQLQCSV